MQIQKKPEKAVSKPLTATKAKAPPDVTLTPVRKEDEKYTDPEVAALLLKAMDELKTRGWTQGGFVNHNTGSVCALGAIHAAARGVEYDSRGHYWLADKPRGSTETSARLLLGSVVPGGSVPAFNDSPYTNERKVIKAFRNALKLVERNKPKWWQRGGWLRG